MKGRRETREGHVIPVVLYEEDAISSRAHSLGALFLRPTFFQAPLRPSQSGKLILDRWLGLQS